jgi:hypothetical protein
MNNISDQFEIIAYSDMSEKRNAFIIKQIENKVGKKVFSYVLNKDHCVINH